MKTPRQKASTSTHRTPPADRLGPWSGWPFQPHRETEENRQRHAQVVQGVEQEYVIARESDSGEDVLIGRGGVTHSYAASVRTELPGELAKLRDADATTILAFARAYGGLGFVELAPPHGGIEPSLLHPSRRAVPLAWLRAHAWGVHICLAVSDALSRPVRPDRLAKQLASYENVVVGMEPYMVGPVPVFRPKGGWETDAVETAHYLRLNIINRNLPQIRRYVAFDGKTSHSFFGYTTPMSVVYWHLADTIDGGIVKRCQADRCGGIFIQTDPRQRFCPPRPEQEESRCAMRQRQRKREKGKRGR